MLNSIISHPATDQTIKGNNVKKDSTPKNGKNVIVIQFDAGSCIFLLRDSFIVRNFQLLFRTVYEAQFSADLCHDVALILIVLGK